MRIAICFWLRDLIFVWALSESVQSNDLAAVDRLLQVDNVGRKNFSGIGSPHDSLLY